MVYLDKYNNPWATKEVYDDHVKRHASELNGHYLEEVRDAYQQVRNHFHQIPFAPTFTNVFIIEGISAMIKYLGIENNKHRYQVMVGSKARMLVVADDDWTVISYHKKF